MTQPKPISGTPVQCKIPPAKEKIPLTITIYGEFDDAEKALIEFGTLDASNDFAPDADPEVDPKREFDAESDSIVVPTFINYTAKPGDRYVKVTQDGKDGTSEKKIITLE